MVTKKRIFLECTCFIRNQAKQAAAKSGITLKEWLGRAVIAYASQEDPKLEEQFSRVYAALEGFLDAGGAKDSEHHADGETETDE